MTRVKICGITNREDALAAAALGADALGFVFAESPRRISPLLAREIIAALPPMVATVGVFVNAHPEQVRQVRRMCGLTMVQLHGNETEHEAAGLGPGVIKAVSLSGETATSPDAYPGAALLIDAPPAGGRPGGNGLAWDWSRARELAGRRQVILAGGLDPDNVAAAIAAVNPCAVDVSSGVEKQPGRKDHERIASFIARAKGFAQAA